MNTSPNFIDAQRQFSAYLRDPDNKPPPAGLPEERLAVYRYAVYANIERFLADNFPRVKSFYQAETWQSLVRDYIVNHRSDTTCFVELPKEFLTYLEEVRDVDEDPIFLYELAHFEWLETLISADERKFTCEEIETGSLLDNLPILNPLTQLLRYSFPVHTVAPDNFPQEAPEEPTFIVAFRKPNNKFGYIDVNILTARLVELLAANEDKTGREVLRDLASEIGVENDQSIVDSGEDILNRLMDDEIIIGIRPRP